MCDVRYGTCSYGVVAQLGGRRTSCSPIVAHGVAGEPASPLAPHEEAIIAAGLNHLMRRRRALGW